MKSTKVKQEKVYDEDTDDEDMKAAVFLSPCFRFRGSEHVILMPAIRIRY